MMIVMANSVSALESYFRENFKNNIILLIYVFFYGKLKSGSQTISNKFYTSITLRKYARIYNTYCSTLKSLFKETVQLINHI